MVGRAPKKPRTKASDPISRPQGSRVSPGMTIHQSDPESGSSPQPVVCVSVPGDPSPAVNNTIGDFATASAETEINGYLQNLLNDYPDLPLVSSGATDSFWPATENLLPIHLQTSMGPLVSGAHLRCRARDKLHWPTRTRRACPISTHLGSPSKSERRSQSGPN